MFFLARNNVTIEETTDEQNLFHDTISSRKLEDINRWSILQVGAVSESTVGKYVKPGLKLPPPAPDFTVNEIWTAKFSRCRSPVYVKLKLRLWLLSLIFCLAGQPGKCHSVVISEDIAREPRTIVLRWKRLSERHMHESLPLKFLNVLLPLY